MRINNTNIKTRRINETQKTNTQTRQTNKQTDKHTNKQANTSNKSTNTLTNKQTNTQKIQTPHDVIVQILPYKMASLRVCACKCHRNQTGNAACFIDVRVGRVQMPMVYLTQYGDFYSQKRVIQYGLRARAGLQTRGRSLKLNPKPNLWFQQGP